MWLQLLLLIIPIELASASIDTLGQTGDGVPEMWNGIKSVFPHSDADQYGFTLILFIAMDFVLKTIAAAAVIMVIYAGIKMITGGEEGLGEGKKIITYAVVGIICALLADVVVSWVCEVVLTQIGGGGSSCPNIVS